MINRTHAAAQAEMWALLVDHEPSEIEWWTEEQTGHLSHRKILDADPPIFDSGSTTTYHFAVRKPTGRFPRIDLPLPETEAPPIGTEYWVPNPAFKSYRETDFWGNDKVDKMRLERGLVYLSETDAALVGAHAQVLGVEG